MTIQFEQNPIAQSPLSPFLTTNTIAYQKAKFFPSLILHSHKGQMMN